MAPRPEGPHDFHTQAADLHAGPPPAAPEVGAALTDVVREYALFTPAILFAVGRLDRDPVQEFVNTTPGSVRIAAITFTGRPIFQGLEVAGDPAWNHRLLACDLAHWDALRQALSSLAIVDHVRQVTYTAFYQTVPLADWPALQGRAVLPDPIPEVPVTVIGLLGARQWTLVPGHILRPPRLTGLQLPPGFRSSPLPSPEIRA